ncbi:hypothetical protein WJ60_09935 [Burkholderia ubonensis]|nr:hypothetical protein WJ60_09935 [Burkholderia ubonensis]
MGAAMEHQNELYRGWQLDVAIDGDETAGYYIARQTMRFAVTGGPRNVPIPAARFADKDVAFSDAFERLRHAVEEFEGKPA